MAPAPLIDRLQALLGASYRIDRELTGGGMSRVFVAHEPALKRDVVIKVLPPDLVTATSIARFEREVEVTAQLQHPHILPVITAGGEGDVFYYITPFIKGESLRDRLTKEGKLPFAEGVRIIGELLGAVAFAHARGIIHRDIKPGNVLLSEGHAILADFGISRALAGPDDGQVTTTGSVIGTPAYMAPEHPRDEQADLYAVAVVAYELLAGALPSPAVGGRDTSRLATLVLREDVRRAKSVAKVLARAMSALPGERFATAGEFRGAVEVADRPATRTRAIVGSAIAATAIVGAVAVLEATRPPVFARPEGTLIAVMPFTQLGSDAVAPLGDSVAVRMNLALQEWKEVRTATPRQVRDRLSGIARLDRAAALAAARSVNADRTILGEITAVGDSIQVAASLFDVARGQALRSHTATTSRDAADVQSMRRLVNALLRDGTELPWRSSTDRRRVSLAAWTLYDSALAERRRWRLAEARQLLEQVVASEPDHARASLRLAEVIRWTGRGSPTRPELDAARRAVEGSAQLDPLDSLLANGELALSNADPLAACGAFSAARRIDSLSFAANFGLGECTRSDEAVVPSRASPSGYAFRASWNAAARFYEAAIASAERPAPSFLFSRLAQVRQTDRAVLRSGHLAGEPRLVTAYPELLGDTVGFAPMPRSTSTPIPKTRDAALERNIGALLGVVGAWARDTAASAEAHLQYAELLEQSRGAGAAAGLDGATPLSEITLSRRINRDTVVATRLLVAHVRLLIKVDSVRAARLLADSALQRWRAPGNEQASYLIGLAALTGRVDRAVSLARQLSASRSRMIYSPEHDSVGLLPAVAFARAEYSVRASFGACDAATQALPGRIRSLVDGSYPPASRPAWLLDAITETPASLSFPCGGAGPLGTYRTLDRIVAVQRAIARGDTAAARARLREADSVRRNVAVSALPISYVNGAATAELLLGDTAAALRRLNGALDDLLAAPRTMLNSEVGAAGLVRAMALAADLAAAADDDLRARRWARAVALLWGGADRPLGSVVQRMRSLAGNQ